MPVAVILIVRLSIVLFNSTYQLWLLRSSQYKAWCSSSFIRSNLRMSWSDMCIKIELYFRRRLLEVCIWLITKLFWKARLPNEIIHKLSLVMLSLLYVRYHDTVSVISLFFHRYYSKKKIVCKSSRCIKQQNIHVHLARYDICPNFWILPGTIHQ